MPTLKNLQDLAYLRPAQPLIYGRASIWAMLFVSRDSEQKISQFLAGVLGIRHRYQRRNLHMTLYHARRRLPGLGDSEEFLRIEIPAEDFRLMAMAPGGENPRPDIDMTAVSIGLRLRRASPQAELVLAKRSAFYLLETERVLGGRLRSTHRRSAFGARSYQPHVNLLRGGSGIDPDLTNAGKVFRAAAPPLIFDRLVVKCRSFD